MSGKDKDNLDDLAPDAALATDLGDEDERMKQQIAHMGGEIDEEIDEEDFSEADRGDTIEDPAEVEARLKAKGADKSDDEDEEDDSKGKDKKDDEDEEDTDEEADDTDEEDEEDGEEEDSDDDSDSEEDDDDESEEDDDESEEEDDDADVAKSKGIPKTRFDAVNERMKRAEKRLAELENEKTAAKKAEEEAYDFDEAEKEYIELVQDGKTDEALAKRKEIRAAEKKSLKAEVTSDATRTVDHNAVQREINDLSVQAEKLYPVFDADHEDFDEKVAAKVMHFFAGNIASGDFDDKAEAFIVAIADVVDLYDLDTKYPGDKDTQDRDKDTQKKKVTKKAPKKKSKKKVEEEKGKSPPPVGDGGEAGKDRGAAVPNVEEMSDEEFEALPESTQAKLRGDFM